MPRTEQSAPSTGREQDRTALPHVSADILELEDMALAFGARIPASLTHFSAPMEAAYGLHPFS